MKGAIISRPSRDLIICAEFKRGTLALEWNSSQYNTRVYPDKESVIKIINSTGKGVLLQCGTETVTTTEKEAQSLREQITGERICDTCGGSKIMNNINFRKNNMYYSKDCLVCVPVKVSKKNRTKKDREVNEYDCHPNKLMYWNGLSSIYC